ncbi:MAG: pantetheine-phosphate adenylyltransferase [Phycisphaerales bacterium]|nr:pantetheine-phosphate adenylyltransferase [Phycisphaerales bacterium]
MPGLHKAIYAGSFDPATLGHLDIIKRGRRLFDELVVAVGRNPAKDQLFTPQERVEMCEQLIANMANDEPNAGGVRVESYEGLTVDFAARIGAQVILRGIRNLSDLQNEIQQAITNHEVGNTETVFITSGFFFAYTSSSLIKQITALGDDLDRLSVMVPALVIERLKEKKKQGHPLLKKIASTSYDENDN